MSMTRWLSLTFLLAGAAASPAMATGMTPASEISRWSIAGSLGADVGYLYSTHPKLGAVLERRFFDSRLSLASMLLFGAGPKHLSLQPGLQVGLAFRTGRRLTVMPALRIGYALMRVGMPVGWRTAHDVVASGSCEFRFDLWQRWRLGVTPLALTVYLPDPWGAVLEPQLALLHDF